jgi:hypothetical protein
MTRKPRRPVVPDTAPTEPQEHEPQPSRLITPQPWRPMAPWMATTIWLEDLTNAELAVLVTQEILAPLARGTSAHDLVSEVIDRLEGRRPNPMP